LKFKLKDFLSRKFNQIKVVCLDRYSNDDVKITKAKYFCKNKTALNLEKPQEFMEKIQWLKLYYYKEAYGQYVDKFDVRTYVEKKIGSEYLNQMIGVYDSVDEIDFKSLPTQYVIKGTHGSGYNIIVKDSSLVKEVEVKRKLELFLKSNYYFKNREIVYKNVKPRILIEKFILNYEETCLIDYKFYCFHGQPKYVLVKKNENGKEKKCFYDLNWKEIYSNENHNNSFESEVEKPANFEKMIELATVLSKEFIFIRVDFYLDIDKIVFGELTFFPTGGNTRLKINHLNQEMGSLIKLPF
jgi:hypothetical protein